MTCENNIISRGYGSFPFILYAGTSRGYVIMSKYCEIKLERQFFRFICHMKFGKNFLEWMWQEPVDGYDMHVLDPGFAECQLSKHSETHACGE